MLFFLTWWKSRRQWWKSEALGVGRKLVAGLLSLWLFCFIIVILIICFVIAYPCHLLCTQNLYCYLWPGLWLLILKLTELGSHADAHTLLLFILFVLYIFIDSRISVLDVKLLLDRDRMCTFCTYRYFISCTGLAFLVFLSHNHFNQILCRRREL